MKKLEMNAKINAKRTGNSRMIKSGTNITRRKRKTRNIAVKQSARYSRKSCLMPTCFSWDSKSMKEGAKNSAIPLKNLEGPWIKGKFKRGGSVSTIVVLCLILNF